ncbi:hypothetical protein ACA910_001977 [Epithemia clementina (nom. ined.)]
MDLEFRESIEDSDDDVESVIKIVDPESTVTNDVTNDDEGKNNGGKYNEVKKADDDDNDDDDEEEDGPKVEDDVFLDEGGDGNHEGMADDNINNKNTSPGSGDEQQSLFRESVTSFMQAKGRPKQWIRDRCNGRERVMDPDSKPKHYLLYPNGLLKLAPGLLESNPVMEYFGKIGFKTAEWYRLRRKIFLYAMIASLIGCIFMMFVDLAMSKKYGILQTFHFSRGDVEYSFAFENFTSVERTTTLYVGLRSVAWMRDITRINIDQYEQLGGNDPTVSDIEFSDRLDPYRESARIVVDFSDFCTGDESVWFVEPGQCDSCNQASSHMIRSVLLATILYLLSLKNDWIRFWVNYDVNCQKIVSFFLACVTVFLSLNTLLRYHNECFGSLRQGSNNCFFHNGTVAKCPKPEMTDDFHTMTEEDIADFQRISWATLEWKTGPCFILLGIAIILRVFSMFCHLSVPTPPITRDREMQWEYERIARAQDKDLPPEETKREPFAPW